MSLCCFVVRRLIWSVKFEKSMLRFRRQLIEPAHEIEALYALRKLILQTHMRIYAVGLCVTIHTSCVRTAKALARLRGCAGSPEHSLVAYVIRTIISWAGSIAIFISGLIQGSVGFWFTAGIILLINHVKRMFVQVKDPSERKHLRKQHETFAVVI